jgi:hypothetical protein
MKRIVLALFVTVSALVFTNSAMANNVSLNLRFDHNDHYLLLGEWQHQLSYHDV